jgi:hypothetical protein
MGGGGEAIPFVMAGTVFMNLEEEMPTKGRVLIYQVETKGIQRQLVLRHAENLGGSVQAMAFVNDSYLIVGVNHEVMLYQVILRQGPCF